VMQMGQDDGVDIPPRVNLHIVQTRADLFIRRHFDVDFLGEEWIPPRQIAGHGVPRGVARVDDEAAFGVLDEPAKDRPWADPALVKEDVELALQGRTAIDTALLREFELCGSGRNGRHLDHLLPAPTVMTSTISLLL
jgi:hypothetical protein